MSEENGQSAYVVLRQDTDGQWQEVGDVVHVPQRTKRKTIIEKAFAELGTDGPVPGATWKVRVLDEESAREISVGSEEQPPRLKIG